ncbi:hypothetical protein [Pseudomonas phoenicis]|uniref:hypothetical protein n=1 Tax=unclassified Pseudomonas TaxID=196821 RepID=UPI0039A17205
MFSPIRMLFLALAASLTAACVPYTGGGQYRTEVYSVEREVYPSDGYYVVPQPRYRYDAPPRYYPAPRGHYRVVPDPRLRPYAPPPVIIRERGPRYDYGHRQRYDYGRDRDRYDYRSRPGRDGPYRGGPGNWPGRGEDPRQHGGHYGPRR